MKKLLSFLSTILCLFMFFTLALQTPALAASVQRASRFASTVIDGKVTGNEWSGAPAVQLPRGFLYVQNSLDYLYLLVDLTSDTYSDPPTSSGDYFWLTFDINRDHLITPNVDLNYGLYPGTYNLGKQYYLGPGVWTGLSSSVSKLRAGFGVSPKSATPHRIWELAIDLNEIKATPGNVVRLGLKTRSQNPYFDSNFPASFYYNFADLVEVTLARAGPSYFYLVTNSGVIRVDSAGTKTSFVNAYQSSYSIYTQGDMIYITSQTRGGYIKVHNFQAALLNTVNRPSVASQYLELTALPQGRFALSDNINDKVYFVNSAGTLLATANIRDTPDGNAQNLCGIVVGNKLVLSENGQKRIIQFDLTTYARTTLRDLSSLPESWLGSITYANGRYYVCTPRSVYSFTSSTSAIVKVADIPESNIVGIGVLDSCYAYVAVNFGGKIYRVDLSTGTSKVFVSGLNYPRDMAATTGARASFSDGFETGSFSMMSGYAWTYGETDSVVYGSIRRAGYYSARFTSNGGYGYERAYCFRNILETSNIYVRGYFYVSTSGIGNSFYFISLKPAGTTSAAYVGLKRNPTTGAVNWFFNCINGYSYPSPDKYSGYLAPHAGHWYCVELHWRYSNSAGYAEVWINGVYIGSTGYRNTALFGGITQVQFGLPQLYNCGPTRVYTDSARISTSYIGTTP